MGKQAVEDIAKRLVSLLGNGPRYDPTRVEQTKKLLHAWNDAHWAVGGMLSELEWMRDELGNYEPEDGIVCKCDTDLDYHSCPYDVEINGADPDKDTCKCCAYCEHQCAMDI